MAADPERPRDNDANPVHGALSVGVWNSYRQRRIVRKASLPRTGRSPKQEDRLFDESPLTATAAHKLLVDARKAHERAVLQANRAMHERGKAVYRAHLEAGLSWAQIAADLNIARPTAVDLMYRYERAVAQGRDMGMLVKPLDEGPPPTR